MNEAEVKSLLKEFFRILELKEETDEGRVFKPTYISSCRALDGAKLGEVLQRLKEIANES